MSEIFKFLRYYRYVQYSLNRGNLLAKMKTATPWELHEYRFSHFYHFGGNLRVDLFKQKLTFSDHFHIACIQLRKCFITKLFAKVSISGARKCQLWYVRPYCGSLISVLTVYFHDWSCTEHMYQDSRRNLYVDLTHPWSSHCEKFRALSWKRL